jgi:hypothetical protein
MNDNQNTFVICNQEDAIFYDSQTQKEENLAKIF